jgi:putative spermidine/putrescine transport system ATP-binding protein
VQAGSPQEIHDRPQDVFVADFTGFRNFLPVQVTTVDTDGRVEGAGNGMRIRGRSRHAVAPGAPAVAAIRPDDVQLGHEPAGGNTFRGKVEIVEYLGRENEAVVTLEAGPRLWVRTSARMAPGEAVVAVLPEERVIFLPPAAAEQTT